MTKATEPHKRRRAPNKPAEEQEAKLNGGEVLPPLEGATADQRVTVLARQLGWLRNQYAVLVDRFVAGEVHSQRLNWDQAANLRMAELGQLERVLQQLEQQ